MARVRSKARPKLKLPPTRLTGWLSLALAAVAGSVFLVTRYLSVIKTPILAGRLDIVIAAVGALVLLVLFGGNHNMWRAMFITLLVFLVVGTGAGLRQWAAVILLGIALVSLVGGNFSFGRALLLTLAKRPCSFSRF